MKKTTRQLLKEHNGVARALGRPELGAWKQSKAKLRDRIDELAKLVVLVPFELSDSATPVAESDEPETVEDVTSLLNGPGPDDVAIAVAKMDEELYDVPTVVEDVLVARDLTDEEATVLGNAQGPRPVSLSGPVSYDVPSVALGEDLPDEVPPVLLGEVTDEVFVVGPLTEEEKNYEAQEFELAEQRAREENYEARELKQEEFWREEKELDAEEVDWATREVEALSGRPVELRVELERLRGEPLAEKVGYAALNLLAVVTEVTEEGDDVTRHGCSYQDCLDALRVLHPESSSIKSLRWYHSKARAEGEAELYDQFEMPDRRPLPVRAKKVPVQVEANGS